MCSTTTSTIRNLVSRPLLAIPLGLSPFIRSHYSDSLASDIIILLLAQKRSVCVCFFLFFLVNPIASSQIHNAPQQNLIQNYSLHPNPMQANSYDPSYNSATNFNNFDPSNQFQMQFQQQHFNNQYQGGHIQQQFMGQSSIVGQQQELHNQGINGSTSAYQHSINDLLVQPTVTLQQNLFSNQDTVSGNQSVS